MVLLKNDAYGELYSILLDNIDELHREAGDGSVGRFDDIIDDSSSIENHHWSQGETTFRISDAPKSTKHIYKRLYRANMGYGSLDRASVLRTAHIRKDIESFCAILEMIKNLESRVKSIVLDDIDLKEAGSHKYEPIVLATCTLVHDEYLSNQDNVSLDDRIKNSDKFQSLMEANNTDYSEISDLRPWVRERSRIGNSH